MRSLANVPRSSDNHIGREELKMDRLVTDVLVIGGVRLVNQGREACATTHVTDVPIAWHIIGTTKYY